jgi:hypothetical protein
MRTIQRYNNEKEETRHAIDRKARMYNKNKILYIIIWEEQDAMDKFQAQVQGLDLHPARWAIT